MGKKERKRHFKREDVGLNAEHLSLSLAEQTAAAAAAPPDPDHRNRLLHKQQGRGFCVAAFDCVFHLVLVSKGVFAFTFVLIFWGPRTSFTSGSISSQR